jgi:uncharacterized protein (TIGR02466 family)
VSAPDPFEPIALFSVPLFPTVVAGFDERKPALLADILDLRARYPGVVRSNRSAWHSGDELAAHKSENVAWVLQKAVRFARHVLGRFHDNWSAHDLALAGVWANVLDQGGWNAPHHHAPCTWSGVFYVSVGEVSTSRADPHGMIEFMNPMPWMSQIGRAGNFVYGPKDGLLLLFPSAVHHFVHPHVGADPRVSIAFNFNVVAKGRA